MWSNERTAGTQLGWAGLPAVLFLLGLLTFCFPVDSRAEDGNDNQDAAKLRAGFDIRDAVEVEFFAEQGKVYTVEARGAGGDWSAFYGPLYGGGTEVGRRVANPAGFSEFRLVVADLAPLGHAPSDLEEHAYSLNYGTKVTGFSFGLEGLGIAKSPDGAQRGFAYSYRKTRPDVGELVLEFDGGVREAITLNFHHGRVGDFHSVVSREGRRPRKASGTFRAGGDVSADNATAPQTLEGSRFMFRDRGMVSVINFITDFSGSLSRQGGDTEVISYTYDISSWPEVSLVVTPAGADETHDYTLVFNARNSGMFERRIIRDNRVRDTDRGKFSGKGEADEDDDGKGGGDTEPECLAPDDLEGRTLQARINGKVATIVFNGPGAGTILKKRANGRVILQPFTYTYSRESCKEGLLTMTLPKVSGDEVQVYELDFTTAGSGKCVRKLYEEEELDDTDNGTFSLSEEDGGGIAGVPGRAAGAGRVGDDGNNEGDAND